MPPKKDKVSDAQAEEQCLAYLKAQNRPYNTTDIHKNLHEPFSKAVCQKALTALSERNEILAKSASKSVVYCAIQDDALDLDETEMSALDAEIINLNTRLQQLKEETKVLNDRNISYQTNSRCKQGISRKVD